MYGGLETSKAFERVHPAPDERRLHIARPDLDASAAQHAHARYLRSAEDERAAHRLLMRSRAEQRQVHARQRAESRSLEQRLRTPFSIASGRRESEAHERALREEKEAPRFEGTKQIEQTLALALARARGVRGHHSGVASTHVREKQQAASQAQTDASFLMHPPNASVQPPANALAVARLNERMAAMRTNGARRSLGVGQLHLLVGHMLEEKLQQDSIDDAQRSPRQPFPEFVSDELWRRYGLRELATKHGRNLKASAIEQRGESSRIRAFCGAMGWLAASEPEQPVWTEPHTHFLLAFLPLLFEVEQVRERLGEAGPVWLSLLQLRQAVRKMLYSKALEVRATIRSTRLARARRASAAWVCPRGKRRMARDHEVLYYSWVWSRARFARGVRAWPPLGLRLGALGSICGCSPRPPPPTARPPAPCVRQERMIAECEALAEDDPTGEKLSGKRVSFDRAIALLLGQFEPQWDTLVSHLHRPTYAEVGAGAGGGVGGMLGWERAETRALQRAGAASWRKPTAAQQACPPRTGPGASWLHMLLLQMLLLRVLLLVLDLIGACALRRALPCDAHARVRRACA
jgi:hypothetical protein